MHSSNTLSPSFLSPSLRPSPLPVTPNQAHQLIETTRAAAAIAAVDHEQRVSTLTADRDRLVAQHCTETEAALVAAREASEAMAAQWRADADARDAASSQLGAELESVRSTLAAERAANASAADAVRTQTLALQQHISELETSLAETEGMLEAAHRDLAGEMAAAEQAQIAFPV